MQTIITTHEGTPLRVTVTPNFTTGEATYRVDGIGAFTFTWHHTVAPEPPAVDDLFLSCGLGEPEWGPQREAPVINEVTLVGYGFITPDEIQTHRGSAAQTLRNGMRVNVEPDIAHTATSITTALAAHFLGQAWTSSLRRGLLYHHAASVRRHAEECTRGLTRQIEDAHRQIQKHLAHAALATEALRAGPVVPPPTSDNEAETQ
ncbi:hypothetical protein [Streptomyces luteireticuli]|uniref:hypothetical protein n=1 Tax=Streptomyces luteireticuli TaxID=173858 RepID=UPI003557A005